MGKRMENIGERKMKWFKKRSTSRVSLYGFVIGLLLIVAGVWAFGGVSEEYSFTGPAHHQGIVLEDRDFYCGGVAPCAQRTGPVAATTMYFDSVMAIHDLVNRFGYDSQIRGDPFLFDTDLVRPRDHNLNPVIQR